MKLQICPLTLTYTREIRLTADVFLSVIPRATGVEVVHERGYLIILTDLLLICERMTRDDANRAGGPDMWLLYPPLAGKHLRVALIDNSSKHHRLNTRFMHLYQTSDTAFTVTILKKETLTVQTDSPQMRDRLMREFKECIETGATGMSCKTCQPFTDGLILCSCGLQKCPSAPACPFATPEQWNAFRATAASSRPPRLPRPEPQLKYEPSSAKYVGWQRPSADG